MKPLVVASRREDRPLLFTDRNGVRVRAGEFVQLTGLSNKSYNGQYGIVRGDDPKAEGRCTVQLIHRNDRISFKSSNLTRWVFKPTPLDWQRALQQTPRDPDILKGLIDRPRLADLLDRRTWPDLLAELGGRCVVVTCSSLLTCLGYLEPNIWQDALVLASRLLAPGGYFLQYDTAAWGRFGHARTMKAYVEYNELGLILEGRKDEQECGHGKMYILLWRKT